jgi:hypothetical protein
MSNAGFWPEATSGADQVSTSYELFAPANAVWQCLMFYEDVPRRPWPLLRLILPQPLHSEGDKLTVGGLVRCTYSRGYLLKRSTEVDADRRLRFEVVEQKLGIERRARARCGSYELEPTARGTCVTLTTVYESRLWPRFLWRPVERYLCHRLHQHILFGMQEQLVGAGSPGPRVLSAPAPKPKCTAAAPSP